MVKGTIISAIAALLTLTATNVSFGKYSGGTGEPNDPYRIETPNDLNDIGNHVEDFNKHFVMVNDINLSEYTGTQFNIIGPFFCGVFDGNDHAISNFTYDGEGTDVGLFSHVSFCLEDPLWSVIKDLTLIEPDVNAPSGDSAGALVGSLGDATVRDCRIQGGRISGGSDCIVGGLVGHNGGIIRRCSSTASVSSAGHYVGGLVGAMIEFSLVEETDLISNCYSAGRVSGPASFIGGLVGGNAHTVEYSYSSGQVAPDANAGGLVGFGGGYYTKCFWDSTVNPDVNGIGNGSDPNVIGKTTVDMMTENTFVDAGWDFVEVWDIGEGQTYPFLRVYPAGDLNHDGLVNFADVAILALHWLEGIQ
jgi:hypothetical protein